MSQRDRHAARRRDALPAAEQLHGDAGRDEPDDRLRRVHGVGARAAHLPTDGLDAAVGPNGRIDGRCAALRVSFGEEVRRSFIMPIGEHLLRMVEQIELVASSTSDLLLAFRVSVPAAAADGEWRDVRSEMDHYGEQAEKAALQRAEMPLKKGVVRPLVARLSRSAPDSRWRARPAPTPSLCSASRS